MRALASLLVVALLVAGVYFFYLKKMPTSDQGTAPTQAISLTGVRADLLQIAQAERGYLATNGHCATLDELLSSNSLSMARSERDGYSYSVECAAGDFTVTAHHAPAPANSPIRYPTLAVDQTMQVHEVN
jgi:Tfp pilus assembly protein PilE